MIRGSIPEKIVYIDAPSQEFTRTFDDGGEIGVTVRAAKSFVTDAGNEKSIKTGIDWATRKTRSHTKVKTYLTEEQAKNTDDYVYLDSKGWHTIDWKEGVEKTYKPTQEVLENTPFRGLRILSLEYRSQGGRAYKVLFGDRVFDLREDILLDILLTSKVDKGLIDSEFIWAKVGAQMKLIRAGSKLHEELLKATHLKNVSTTIKELNYGDVIQTTTEFLVYLGKHPYVEFKQELRNRSSYGSPYVHRPYVYETKIIEDKPQHVFAHLQDEGTVLEVKLGRIKELSNLRFQKSKPKGVLHSTLELPDVEVIRQTHFKRYLKDEKKKITWLPVRAVVGKTAKEMYEIVTKLNEGRKEDENYILRGLG
jgi:hypothetical protein